MSPRKKTQTVPQVTSAQNAQEILLEMELALLHQIQGVPDGSDEKNRLQDLLSLLSDRKSSESSSPSPKDSAPKTTSPDKGPNLSFASIIGEATSVKLSSNGPAFQQAEPTAAHAWGVIPGCEAVGKVPAENGRPNREGTPRLPGNAGGEGDQSGKRRSVPLAVMALAQ